MRPGHYLCRVQTASRQTNGQRKTEHSERMIPFGSLPIRRRMGGESLELPPRDVKGKRKERRGGG